MMIDCFGPHGPKTVRGVGACCKACEHGSPCGSRGVGFDSLLTLSTAASSKAGTNIRAKTVAENTVQVRNGPLAQRVQPAKMSLSGGGSGVSDALSFMPTAPIPSAAKAPFVAIGNKIPLIGQTRTGGALAGATAGALAGAALGSVVPVFGTAFGGATPND